MSIQLENSEIKVKINSTGAELTSIQKDNLEYLWQADPKLWARHAPILFPIVGRLKNNTYTYNGQQYSLPQHGFARDMDFEVTQNDSLSATFVLNWNESTLKNYPFKFNLIVKYQLVDHSILVSNQVKNAGDEEMFFSIGAHPGFNCPLLSNEKFEDYFLEFEKEENLILYLLKDGMLSGETEVFGNNIQKIPLKTALFDQDALIFKDLKSSRIALKSTKSNRSVEMTIPSFPYLGIWTKPGTQAFLCIEPWFGVADYFESKGNFREKEAIQILKPEEIFTCHYSIKIN